jgi:hypothetical protein
MQLQCCVPTTTCPLAADQWGGRNFGVGVDADLFEIFA